jgi:DNA-binding CsgD family transcriptional regulator
MPVAPTRQVPIFRVVHFKPSHGAAMTRSARLRVSDLRAIHQLVGECRDLGDEAHLWRRHMLVNLTSLTGATWGIHAEGTWEPYCQDGRAVDVGWEAGGNRDLWVDMAAQIAKQGIRYCPMIEPFLDARDKGGRLALSRADVVRDFAWYNSKYYRDFHGAIGGDAVMMTAPKLPNGRMFALSLVRPIGERDFALRHRSVFQEVLTQIFPHVGRHLSGFDEPSPANLPLRHRAVLRCLLEGDSDIEIAARLRLSVYTVFQYVKETYVFFGINSRRELIARWVRRGWGARFGWADDVAAEYEISRSKRLGRRKRPGNHDCT